MSLPGLRKQIWENSTMLVRQLPNMGDVGAVALKERQLSSLEVGFRLWVELAKFQLML